MTTKRALARSRLVLRLVTVVATAAFLPMTIGGAAAHGPDPMLSGGLFAQDQDLRFRWRAGSVPPSVIRSAIALAATQANATRGSRAATSPSTPVAPTRSAMDLARRVA